MYQTPVISATSVSRIAGPVCITRLAMRPAKSFWKNAQDWRTTYQWFCQRMRFDDVGGDRLVGDQVLRRQRERPRDQQHHRHAERDAARMSANSSSGWLAVISVTMRPDEHRDGRIEQRDHEAGREQRRRTGPSPAGRNARRTR